MSTRIDLLDCAENVARRRGYDGFSYADLAKEIGIRKASIHYHFPTKADLAVALIERYSSTFADALAVIDETSDSAADRLSAYIKTYRRASEGGAKICLCVAFSISRDSLSDEVLQELDLFHSNSLAWLVQTFKLAKKDDSVSNLGDPIEEAAALLAIVEGAQLIARAACRVKDYDNATRLVLARLS